MIVCKDIKKEFGEPPQEVLHGISFNVEDGEFLSISGRSGSGKSTLLYIMSTLDHATHGDVLIDGLSVKKMSSDKVHRFRNEKIGFIFQFHYLLPELSTMENILLPARNLKLEKARKNRAHELLERLGISDQAHKLPGQMSGGQQQRVAIARSLIMDPKYIFADEPTGNLDTHNAQVVMNILKETNKKFGTTITLVTHDPDFAAMAEREVYLVDGKIGQKE